MLRIAGSSLRRMLTWPAYAALATDNTWANEPQEHLEAVQEAIYSQKIIDTIANASAPDNQTSLKDWQTLSDQCRSVQVELPDGMQPIESVRTKIMDLFTVGAGVNLGQEYKQQARVALGTNQDRTVFFPTYTVTKPMFNFLKNSGVSFISTGNLGISKTFSLILWCILSRNIANYRAKYGAHTLAEKIVNQYKMRWTPMTYYYTLQPDQDQQTVFDLIANQAIEQRRSAIRESKSPKDMVNNINKGYMQLDIPRRFAFDQINTYCSWVNQKKLKDPNLKKADRTMQYIKTWTPFLQALEQTSSMDTTYNSPVNIQRYLKYYGQKRKSQLFWFNENSHKNVRQKRIQIGHSWQKRQVFQKEMSQILVFNLRLYQPIISLESSAQWIEGVLQSLDKVTWPLYMNFLSMAQVINSMASCDDEKKVLEKIIELKDKDESCLTELITKIKQNSLNQITDNAINFDQESPRSLLNKLDVFQTLLQITKDLQQSQQSRLPMRIQLGKVSNLVNSLQYGDQSVISILKSQLPHLFDTHLLKEDDQSIFLEIFLKQQDLEAIFKAITEIIYQQITNCRHPFDKFQLHELPVKRFLRLAVQNKVIKNLNWSSYANQQIYCDKVATFQHLSQINNSQKGTFLVREHFSKAIDVAKSKGHVIAFPTNSQSYPLFDAVYIKQKPSGQLQIFTICLTTAQKYDQIKQKVQNLYCSWLFDVFNHKNFKEESIIIVPVVLCDKRWVKKVKRRDSELDKGLSVVSGCHVYPITDLATNPDWEKAKQPENIKLIVLLRVMDRLSSKKMPTSSSDDI